MRHFNAANFTISTSDTFFMPVENHSEFGQFRQVQRIIFSVRNNALAALARRTRFARAQPSGCRGVRLINYNSMLRFVVTIRLARHSAGSRIRSAAPRTARPQSFALWRACVSSLSLGWLHFAAPLARCGQDYGAATGGSSFPAAWLCSCQGSRTARPRLIARLPSAGRAASPCHEQHADFAF